MLFYVTCARFEFVKSLRGWQAYNYNLKYNYNCISDFPETIEVLIKLGMVTA